MISGPSLSISGIRTFSRVHVTTVKNIFTFYGIVFCYFMGRFEVPFMVCFLRRVHVQLSGK